MSRKVCTECGEVKSEVIPKLSETQPTVSNGNDGANNSGNQSADKNSNVPATGDEMPILPAVMALVVSAGAVVIIRKRRVAK